VKSVRGASNLETSLPNFLKEGIDPTAHFYFADLIGMASIGRTIQFSLFSMTDPNHVKAFLYGFNEKEHFIIGAVVGFASGKNQTTGIVGKDDNFFRGDLNLGLCFNGFKSLSAT
jgi:hypothetical protein